MVNAHAIILRLARNPRRRSVGRGEDPVATRLQADNIPRLQRSVARRVNLDHRLALAAAKRNLGPLDRTETPDVADRTFERAAARGADLHIVTPDEQFRGTMECTVGSDVQRAAVEAYRAIAHVHRQHDRFANEAMYECRCRMVVDLAGRANLFDP